MEGEALYFLASVLSAGADQNAFDLEVVVFARVNDRVVAGAVLRMQFRFAVDELKLFEREVPLQVGEHDVAAARFNGAILIRFCFCIFAALAVGLLLLL